MEQAIEQRQSPLCWTGMCRVGSVVMSGMILVGLLSGLVFGQDKENWDQVIAAAKKEGKVVIYGSSTFRPAVKEIEPEFMKLYGIKVEYLTGRSREVRERVNTEVRTGKQVADVAHGGGTSIPALWQDGGLANWLPPSLKAVWNGESVLTPRNLEAKSRPRIHPPDASPAAPKSLSSLMNMDIDMGINSVIRITRESHACPECGAVHVKKRRRS